jgi:hypothetical protein
MIWYSVFDRLETKMSFDSVMMALVVFGIGVAICCVSLSIYLMLVKNHYKTKEIELKK